MPTVRIPAGKAMWRRGAAALASGVLACGAASAQEGGACETCPPAASAPTDMSQLYRDAYLNPAAFAPRSPVPPLTGQWTNPRRYRLYFAGEYISYRRSVRDTIGNNGSLASPDCRARKAIVTSCASAVRP